MTLKQHLYVMEKDLRKIDSEMHSQQKYCIGLLQGLKQDFELVVEACYRVTERCTCTERCELQHKFNDAMDVGRKVFFSKM